MTEEWKKLYDSALSVTKSHKLSKYFSVGSVGAAVLTSKGNIYTGVCIDTDCPLDICAERNALSTMFTNGEYEVVKICAVSEDGDVIPPCGVCRAFMMRMGKNAKNIEVLINNAGNTILFKDLIPSLWI
mgnify:CR=1 FL=1